MIDIKYNDDYSYSDIYMMDGLHSSIEIYTHDDSGKVIQLSNEQIHLESFEINQSICSGSDMVFGGCESAYCKFTVTSDFPSLVGKYIWIQSTITNESIEPSRVDNYISLGSYRIVSDEWSANRVSRNITAYDKMYELQTINMYKWYEGLNFPISVGEMRKSAIDYIKLNDDTKGKVYCNDTVKISKVNGLSDLTAANVFRFISEMSGGFGIINTRGYFDIINLKNDSVFIYTSSNIKNMNYEDNKNEKIKIIYCENEKSYTYITNTNKSGVIYPIQNTKLLKNTDISTINAILRNINTVIKDIDYQKFNCDFRGNSCLEIGDKIAYQSTKDNFSGYLTERRIKGIHAITDTASCQQRYASRELPEEQSQEEQGVISSDVSLGGGNIYIVNAPEEEALENLPDDIPDGSFYAIRRELSNYYIDVLDFEKTKMQYEIGTIHQYFKPQFTLGEKFMINDLTEHGKTLKSLIVPSQIGDATTSGIELIEARKENHYYVRGMDTDWLRIPNAGYIYEIDDYEHFEFDNFEADTFFTGSHTYYFHILKYEIRIEATRRLDSRGDYYGCKLNFYITDLESGIETSKGTNSVAGKAGQTPLFVLQKTSDFERYGYGLYFTSVGKKYHINQNTVKYTEERGYYFEPKSYTNVIWNELIVKIGKDDVTDTLGEYSYPNVEEITIPNGFVNDFQIKYIGTYPNLKKLNMGIENFETYSTDNYGGALKDCENLQTVYVYNCKDSTISLTKLLRKSWVRELRISNTCEFTDEKFKLLDKVNSSEILIKYDNLTNLGYSCFYNCYNLTYLSIKTKVKLSIYPSSFVNCPQLVTVRFYTDNVEYIPDGESSLFSGAFVRCNSDLTIEGPVPNGNLYRLCTDAGINYNSYVI